MLQLHLYHLLQNVQHETVIVDSFNVNRIWASVPLTQFDTVQQPHECFLPFKLFL